MLKNDKGITDDMTLQDIFRKFYADASQVKIKDKVPNVNKAAFSLNSFSKRFEARR